MTNNFAFFSICAGCKKRKFYISRAWIQPKHLPMPKVRPQNAMCQRCLNNYKNLKQDSNGENN